MTIGDLSGYSYVGSAYLRPANAPVRDSVTLEAKLNPQSPNEYSVQLPAEIFKVKEDQSSTEESNKKSYRNRDPASQAFLSVADYQSVKHKVDIFV